MVAGSSFFFLFFLPPPRSISPFLPPRPLSSWFLSAEQQLEPQRPFSRHRCYCSLQFSSNRWLEIARLSQAICGARWTADSGGGETAFKEQDWERANRRRGGSREGKEEERPPSPLSSCHPAAAHPHWELGAGRGQSSQFIYHRMGPPAIWGGPIC